MATTTPYSLRLSYVLKDESATSNEESEDPVAPVSSDDVRDDPRTGELTGDWLTLSQTPFVNAPAGGFGKWLTDNGKELTTATYAEYFDQYGSKCAEDGTLSVTIEVRKSRPALAYKIIASYGTLTAGSRTETTESKSISVENATEASLSAYVEGNGNEAVWEGPVFDEKGVQYDTPPTII